MQSRLQKNLVTEGFKQMLGDRGVSEDRRLHIGCANITPSGWINMDGSWNAWLARYPIVRRLFGTLGLVPRDKLGIDWESAIMIHDIRKGLPFPENYMTAIYASHVLEHLYFHEAKELLRECFRVLCPEGIIRLVVPDLNYIIEGYRKRTSIGGEVEDNDAMCPADRLCERIGLPARRISKKNIFYYCYSILKDFHSHKWMYDEQSLSQRLAEAGFINVSKRGFLESEIAGIEEVERKDRLDNGGICLEGAKPHEIPSTH